VRRTFAFVSAVVGLGGMVFLAGPTKAQPPAAAPPAAAPAARPTIAVFNMAAVMRDYGKAKYQVFQLNQQRVTLSGDLVKWRSEYIETQKTIQISTDPRVKDELGRKLLDLQRRVEDKDREINKMLNDSASNIISQLYDDIKTVVDKTAEMNGYHIVFAYPDAVTPEEKANAYLKELKLKPPAAQPFFVAPQVDITGVVVGTLNKWYPPLDAQGRAVDVDKLVNPAPAPPPAGAPAPGGPVPTPAPAVPKM